MTQADIIKIGKDLILKAGLLKKPTGDQKKKFLKLLDNYEKKLTGDTNKYAKVVLGFVADIRGDIMTGRTINIDAIEDDEYLENYFVTKKEVENFNKLIDEKSFGIVFSELQKKDMSKKKIDSAVKKIDSQFRLHFKKINQKDLATNLLIFSTFERNLPIPALNRLSKFMLQHDPLGNDVVVIRRLARMYRQFLKNFYNICVKCYKEKNIHSKFLKFNKDINGTLSLALKAEDASSHGLRSGNALYEYKELLMKMGS